MSFIDLPLPSRSIAIVGRPFAMPAAFVFTVIVLTALSVGLALWQGPGLVRDVRISQNPQIIPDADVLDGECSTRRGLTDCDAHLSYNYNGQHFESDVTLAFVDFSSSDYEVEVVISADQPELATISLGLEQLWNRLAVFAAFMLLFVGGAIGTIIGALKAAGANRALATAGRLELVPVQIIEDNKGFVGYADTPRGPRSRRITRTRMAHGETPLMAVDDKGALVGVAAKVDHVAIPVLLDSRLQRLDLSEPERRAALEAFDAQRGARNIAAKVEASKPRHFQAALRGLMAVGGVLVLMVAGVFGYWVYYATMATDAFDAIGIELNNIMPEPLNLWACTQLEARFGDDRAPFGCVADDYVSWKTSPDKVKSKP